MPSCATVYFPLVCHAFGTRKSVLVGIFFKTQYSGMIQLFVALEIVRKDSREHTQCTHQNAGIEQKHMAVSVQSLRKVDIGGEVGQSPSEKTIRSFSI